MPRPALIALWVAASAISAPSAAAGEVSRAEFFAPTEVYLAQFTEAAAQLKALVAADGYQVVAVTGFTDMEGRALHVGRIYAEEVTTLLVGPRKAYRVMDPAAIAESLAVSGGESLWSSTKRIKDFGRESGVDLVVTGKLEIRNQEARIYLKAVETREASIAWARTVSLPGRAAAGARP